MAVRPENLDNHEKDQALENRDPIGAEKVRADIQRVKKGGPSAEAELDALRRRLADVKSSPPEDEAPHCSDCFQRGVRAALRAVEGQG